MNKKLYKILLLLVVVVVVVCYFLYIIVVVLLIIIIIIIIIIIKIAKRQGTGDHQLLSRINQSEHYGFTPI